MKVLILDGSTSHDQFAKDISSFASSHLIEGGGEVESLKLELIDIKGCMGCFGCWIKTPGICVIDDAGREVAAKMVGRDLLIYITPVVFGGYSYHLKKAVDRLIPNISPLFVKVNGEIHHKKRYDRCPRLIAIGVLDSPDEEKEKIFRRLVVRNAINMHAPSFSVEVISRTEGENSIRGRIGSAIESIGVIA